MSESDPQITIPPDRLPADGRAIAPSSCSVNSMLSVGPSSLRIFEAPSSLVGARMLKGFTPLTGRKWIKGFVEAPAIARNEPMLQGSSVPSPWATPTRP